MPELRLPVPNRGALGNPGRSPEARAGGGAVTCPECRAMNSKFLGFVGSAGLRIVEFRCPDCGCIYSVKTETEIVVISHGKTL
ncbi:MAG: hypothetical protein ABSD92_01455 [Candidatus Bathyarchaeia archaeon]